MKKQKSKRIVYIEFIDNLGKQHNTTVDPISWGKMSRAERLNFLAKSAKNISSVASYQFNYFFPHELV